jgi:hypothetical protein
MVERAINNVKASIWGNERGNISKRKEKKGNRSSSTPDTEFINPKFKKARVMAAGYNHRGI